MRLQVTEIMNALKNVPGIENPMPLGHSPGLDHFLDNFYFSGKYFGMPCFMKFSRRKSNLIRHEYEAGCYAQSVLGESAVKMFAIADVAGGKVCIMELLDCSYRHLSDASRRGLVASVRENILLQLTTATSKMRACGLFHRDFHGANILVDGYGKIKIIDWQTASFPTMGRDLYFEKSCRLKVFLKTSHRYVSPLVSNDRIFLVNNGKMIGTEMCKFLRHAWCADWHLWDCPIRFSFFFKMRLMMQKIRHRFCLWYVRNPSRRKKLLRRYALLRASV